MISPSVAHSLRPIRASGATLRASGRPSAASTSRCAARCTTSPNTITHVPISCSPVTRHSKAIGAPATRGGRTERLGSRPMPARSNSLWPRGNGVAESFIADSIASVPMHSTNSPVARALARVSLCPTEVKHTVGGSTPATVVNECGARLSLPSASTSRPTRSRGGSPMPSTTDRSSAVARRRQRVRNGRTARRAPSQHVSGTGPGRSRARGPGDAPTRVRVVGRSDYRRSRERACE